MQEVSPFVNVARLSRGRALLRDGCPLLQVDVIHTAERDGFRAAR